MKNMFIINKFKFESAHDRALCKSFIGKSLGALSPEERLEESLGITALCFLNDVHIIRFHDMKENKKVLKVLEAIKCIKCS
ncbi:MAG: hypothetical protein N2312_06555 [Dictyoglomaceae bacterium]|nr:hypothetical protein [Dictyoglomaceae bacterium]